MRPPMMSNRLTTLFSFFIAVFGLSFENHLHHRHTPRDAMRHLVEHCGLHAIRNTGSDFHGTLSRPRVHDDSTRIDHFPLRFGESFI